MSEDITTKAIEAARAALTEAVEAGAGQVVAEAMKHGVARLTVNLEVDAENGVVDIGPAKLNVRAVGMPQKDAFGGCRIDPRQPELI
jgi:hypothetical protein